MDVYEIRTNTKELLYKGDDYTLAVQSYYDFQEESENDIESKLFGLKVIGYINGRKDEYLYKKGGKLTGGPLYKKGDAVSNKDIIYRVVSVLRDEDNHFHYRISSNQTDMVIIKESELKSAREHHQHQISNSENNLKKLFIIDDFAMTEASAMRESDIYEKDEKAKIYIKELSDFISRNNYPGRMSMSIYKEIESSGNHSLNNALSLLGKFGPEMRNTYKEAYSESKNMYINPSLVKSGNNEKTYKQKIAVLEMLKKDMEKDLSATPKDLLKMEIKIEMLKERSSEKFSKGGVLGYKLDINKIILNNKDRAIEIEQDSLLRGIDVRRSGNIVIVRDFDKIDDVIELLKYNLSFAYPQTKLNFNKGGELTYKQKYNKKYDYPKSEGHSLAEISKDTGVSKKGLQKIYNKGVGAYKTNPQSVRPNVKSPEQWAQARVYSSVMGGKAAKIDAKELKMAKGGEVNSWEYKWGGHEANISKHPRREEYRWYVSVNDGYDYSTDFHNDIDIELETPLEAENNMFRNIDERIGNTPERQISTNSYKKGGDINDGYSYDIEYEDEEGDEYSETFDTIKEAREEIKRLENSDMHDYTIKRKYRYKNGEYLGSFEKGGKTEKYYEISFTFEDEAEQSIGGYASNEQEAKELAKKWVNERGYSNLMNVEAEVVEPPMEKDDEWQLKAEQPFPYYAKGGEILWKKNIGYDGWSSTMENESAYDNEGGYISESGNWKIYRDGRYYYDKWQERENFKRDGDWIVMGMNENGQVEDYKGEFETLSEAKKYIDRWININTEDYEKGGALSKEFKFDKNFVVYVPSTSDVSDKISPKELDRRVNEVKQYVANTFGGYTETETEGGYKSSKGEIVEEDVVKVSVFSKNKDWKDKEYEVVQKSKQWAREWGQEAIGFEYEGDLYYIDGEGKMAKGGIMSWGGTVDFPNGTGWGKYKKGERVLKINELKAYGKYLSESKQFNSKNVVVILPKSSEESMFGTPKSTRFAFVNPNEKRNEPSDIVRFGEELRGEFDSPVKITELDLQDNSQNWNLYKIKGESYEKDALIKRSKMSNGGEVTGYYSSVHDFISRNKLEEESDNLFGKDWEADDDMQQIRELVGQNYEVEEIEYHTARDMRSDDYIHVYRYADGGEGEYGIGGFVTGAVLGAVGGAYVTNKINKTTKKREAEGKKAKAPKYLYQHPLWDNTIYKYLKKKKISNKEIEKLWDKGLKNLPEYLKKRKKLKQSIK